MIQIDIHEPKTNLPNFITETVRDQEFLASGKNQSVRKSITIDENLTELNAVNDNTAQESSEEIKNYDK